VFASHEDRFKMASSSKRPHVRFSGEEVAQMIFNMNSDSESDVDSEAGGISSGEEFELDRELLGESDEEAEPR